MSPVIDEYHRELQRCCFRDIGGRNGGVGQLSYRAEALSLWPRSIQCQRAIPRQISSVPDRVLDAPGMFDDFYLNPISWSSRNLLAVALRNSVYLWNPVDASVHQFLGGSLYVSSVSFSGSGQYLAVGMSDGDVLVYDGAVPKLIRTLRGSTERVSALSWNGRVLTTGNRRGDIFHFDGRARRPLISQLSHHVGEVCGLKWSPDGSQLASGGNDNLCCIWESPSTVQPLRVLDSHVAAVKALTWSPHRRGLLASGGGTADKTIRMWDTSTFENVSVVNTGSQVCGMEWSVARDEVISCHGLPRNQLIVWDHPSMKKVAELSGHSSRVLSLAQSPNGDVIVSGSGDETLRFWRINSERRRSTTSVSESGTLSGGRMIIR